MANQYSQVFELVKQTENIAQSFQIPTSTMLSEIQQVLKPTKTTKQKRNRNLAEFYGRKWAEVLRNGALRCIAPFYRLRK